MAHPSFGKPWPADRRADMRKVSDGNDLSVYVHFELAELVALLMRETERRGYRLNGPGCHPNHPQGESWGYARRPIAGTDKPSNHSTGTALDFNAPSNPMTSKLITDMPSWMPALWKSYGFRWGGDYDGRKDSMHYEFMGSVSEARAYTLMARIAFGSLSKPVPPLPTHVTPEEDVMLAVPLGAPEDHPSDKNMIALWSPTKLTLTPIANEQTYRFLGANNMIADGFNVTDNNVWNALKLMSTVNGGWPQDVASKVAAGLA